MWVSSAQKSLVDRTAFWQRINHIITERINALLKKWHGLCLHSVSFAELKLIDRVNHKLFSSINLWYGQCPQLPSDTQQTAGDYQYKTCFDTLEILFKWKAWEGLAGGNGCFTYSNGRWCYCSVTMIVFVLINTTCIWTYHHVNERVGSYAQAGRKEDQAAALHTHSMRINTCLL